MPYHEDAKVEKLGNVGEREGEGRGVSTILQLILPTVRGSGLPPPR